MILPDTAFINRSQSQIKPLPACLPACYLCTSHLFCSSNSSFFGLSSSRVSTCPNVQTINLPTQRRFVPTAVPTTWYSSSTPYNSSTRCDPRAECISAAAPRITTCSRSCCRCCVRLFGRACVRVYSDVSGQPYWITRRCFVACTTNSCFCFSLYVSESFRFVVVCFCFCWRVAGALSCAFFLIRSRGCCLMVCAPAGRRPFGGPLRGALRGEQAAQHPPASEFFFFCQLLSALPVYCFMGGWPAAGKLLARTGGRYLSTGSGFRFFLPLLFFHYYSCIPVAPVV